MVDMIENNEGRPIAYASRSNLQRRAPIVHSAGRDILQLSDVVAFLSFSWRHKYRIVLGVVAALAVGLTLWLRSSPVFETTAKLLVVKKSPLAVGGRSAIPLNTDAMSTHVAVLTSPWLANHVLQDDSVLSLKTFSLSQNPESVLIKALSVVHEADEHVPMSESNILRLSFRGSYPDDCPIVLNALIEAYTKYLDDSNRSVNQDALKLITSKAEQISEQLAAREAEYEKSSTKLKLLDDRESRLLAKNRRIAIDTTMLTLKTRRAELESRLNALAEASKLESNATALKALLPGTHRARDRHALDEKLLPLLMEQRRLVLRYGPGHPEVRQIEDQIKLTKDLFASTNVDSELREAAAEYARELKQELNEIEAAEGSLRESEETLRQLADSEKTETVEFARMELRDTQLRNAMARDQQYHDALMSQLQGVDIGMASGGYQTTTIAPPNKPIQIAPRIALILVGAIAIGLIAGYGYALVAELLDHSFRSTQEVAQSLHVAVLGQIPSPPKPAGRRSRRRSRELDDFHDTDNSPGNAVAEAYQELRTAVVCRMGSHAHQVVQITSPNLGDGKTALAANLARSLALSGKSVLLIDADWQAPRIHRLFGVAGDSGLASALADTDELDDVIVPSEVQGLSLLPCGLEPSSSADILASPKLNELFDLLRDRYDFVLVNTPPLLSSVDSRIVASQADRVLLAIRHTKNGRPAAAQATEILRFAGAKILGVVLMGTERQAGGTPLNDVGNLPPETRMASFNVS